LFLLKKKFLKKSSRKMRSSSLVAAISIASTFVSAQQQTPTEIAAEIPACVVRLASRATLFISV
jgi:hypothetical protein